MVVDYKQFDPGPGAGLRITLIYIYIHTLTVDSGKPKRIPILEGCPSRFSYGAHVVGYTSHAIL
jgi:hypothetical protein